MRRSLVLALAFAACGKASPPAATAPAPAPASAEATTAPAAPMNAPAEPMNAPEPAAEVDAGAASLDDVTPASPTSAPPEPVKPAALEAAAKALIDRWLAAQNGNDLAAYSALYAPRFTGIKRSGPREKTFGRERWLADRARMFKSAMKVTADDIEVELASDTAIVTLKQTWASGSYQDVGPKLLVLVPEPGGLAIAREEMLASEVQGVGGEAKPVDPAALSFVIHGGNEAWVVVGDPLDDPHALERGTPRLVSKTDPTVVVDALDQSKLDPAQAAWLGKKVSGPSGCSATIDRLELVGRYTPHFGVVQTWNGTDTVEVGKPMADDAIAADAWGSGLQVVVGGHLSGCGDSWVHAADHPVATPYADLTPDAALERSALAATRALPGWKAIQAEAASSEPPVTTATWDVYEGAAPTVQAWTDKASGRAFVYVKAVAGSGCGQFGGSFGALFEVKDLATKPTFVLLSDPDGGPIETIVDVLDLDGDGDVELILEEGLIQRVGPVWRTTVDLTPPSYDCPC